MRGPREGGCDAAGLWQPTAHSPASCTTQPSCAGGGVRAPSRIGASLVVSSRIRLEPPPFGGRLTAARGTSQFDLRTAAACGASPPPPTRAPSTGADAEGSRPRGCGGCCGGGCCGGCCCEGSGGGGSGACAGDARTGAPSEGKEEGKGAGARGEWAGGGTAALGCAPPPPLCAAAAWAGAANGAAA